MRELVNIWQKLQQVLLPRGNKNALKDCTDRQMTEISEISFLFILFLTILYRGFVGASAVLSGSMLVK